MRSIEPNCRRPFLTGRAVRSSPLLLAGFLALPAAAQQWPADLPSLAAALRACLDNDTAAFATDAAAPEEGRVLVRLWRDGNAEDCLATLTGEVLGREARPGLRPPDPSAPAFFLERRCVDARRLDAPDRRVLGWVAYPACG